MEWEKPTYRGDEKSIQVPTKEKCNMLMASAHGVLSMKIDLSTQTGLRPCEIQGEKGLRAEDIHIEQRTVTARSAKNCNPRPPLPISQELTTRLQRYIIKNNINPKDRLFKGKARNYGDHFRRFKNRLAIELADPSIKSIRLYDLRHAYITNLLRKIQNAEIVRQKVGHKRLNTTQKYFHLIPDNNGEWIVEGTTDKERAKQLLKEDFTYQLTTPDGTMIFRKPK
jgi:integrase